MIKTYFLAKVLHKLRLSSFHNCEIDKTARVDSESTLSDVTIGRYSYVASHTGITSAVIGQFCSIGGSCGIGGGKHPINAVSTSPVFLKGRSILRKHFAEVMEIIPEKVTIGNDVWIGDGVFILPGVNVGDGAIIGANAVVTRDVEPYSIVAGAPAREIRKRFDDETISKFLELKWWDWPEETLKKAGGCFDSPEKLFNMVLK